MTRSGWSGAGAGWRSGRAASGGPLRLPAPVIERYAGQPWPQSGF